MEVIGGEVTRGIADMNLKVVDIYLYLFGFGDTHTIDSIAIPVCENEDVEKKRYECSERFFAESGRERKRVTSKCAECFHEISVKSSTLWLSSRGKEDLYAHTLLHTRTHTLLLSLSPLSLSYSP